MRKLRENKERQNFLIGDFLVLNFVMSVVVTLWRTAEKMLSLVIMQAMKM